MAGELIACDSCRYWKTGYEDLGEGYGKCLRRCPQYLTEEKKSCVRTAEDHITQWPITHELNECGDGEK